MSDSQLYLQSQEKIMFSSLKKIEFFNCGFSIKVIVAKEYGNNVGNF